MGDGLYGIECERRNSANRWRRASADGAALESTTAAHGSHFDEQNSSSLRKERGLIERALGPDSPAAHAARSSAQN
jgi:hypothetical protein